MSEEVYWQVISAKKAHRKWIGYAQLLIERGEVDEEMVPTNETECCFGQWYYSEGQQLIDIPVFKEIGLVHEQLHAKYNEIFAILFREEESGLFAKLFGKKTKVSDEDLMKAKSKCHELNTLSHQLTDKINLLIKEMKLKEA